MADGEFAHIPILKIGDSSIPIVAFHAPQVRPWNEFDVALGFDFRLKDESFIANHISHWRSAIH